MNWTDWIEENCIDTWTDWYNGILYKFGTLKDGWVAIFEIWNGKLYPMIQAMDRDKAISWCVMREPVTVPMERIC